MITSLQAAGAGTFPQLFSEIACRHFRNPSGLGIAATKMWQSVKGRSNWRALRHCATSHVGEMPTNFRNTR